MRFFALDTDLVDRIRLRYCSANEQEIFLTRFHWLSFVFRTLREILTTVVLVAAVIVAIFFDWEVPQVLMIVGSVWLIFVFFRVLHAFIDWRFDLIMLTTERVILVDQTSFFRHQEQQIHLENIGGVSTTTQFLDIFPFGKLTLHLKEGLGGDTMIIPYVPGSERLASVIADVVAKYQRMGHPNNKGGGNALPIKDA